MKAIAALLLVAAIGCHKDEPPRAAPHGLPAEEVQRAHEACDAYVAKACGCTAPAARDHCMRAKALPPALDLALATAVNPGDSDAAREISARAQVNVRETVKQCVEEIAKLPALGCP